MEPDFFAIKLGKNIAIGYEINGQKLLIKDKEQNSMFNYSIDIDNNIKIDLNDIINCIIEEKFGNIGKDINLTYNDEIYRINILNSKKIYLFEEILVKLFEKIDKIIYNSVNFHLNKAIIIYNNIPYELRLIIHRAALMSRIKIINFIDLNKTIKFHLEYSNEINNNSLTLIKIDEKIEVSVFEKKNKLRILNSILNKTDINFENLILEEVINEIKNEENFEYLKNIIDKLIIKSYGIKKEIDKIYIYKNIESENLNEISIFGAIYSNNFPISKESILVFNFFDYCENYPINQLLINDYLYEISQKTLEINFEDNNIPFEDCYYRHIRIEFFNKGNKDTLVKSENIITFYYYQKNIYCCSKDIKLSTSSEFIFFKTFPNITINDKYSIDIQEKFENIQIFKRVNILNVNRENIKLNSDPLSYCNVLEPSDETLYEISEEFLFPDVLFLVGKNLRILSYFNKDIFYNSSFVDDKLKIKFLNLIKNIELFDKDDSLNNLNKKNQELLKMFQDYSSRFNLYYIIEKYSYGNIQKFNKYDEEILIKYGKYLIFEQIFYKNNNLEINEANYNIYNKIKTSLNLFIDKCKVIEKNSLQFAKLYFSGCHALINYLEKSNNIKEDIIFDIIQFENDSIYKDANENNLYLILNLTKNSFLYPYFVQFNSSFNKSMILEDDKRNYIETCKISMITLNQIKLDLIKSLPKYGIRIYFNTDYYATTILNTGITTYNEKKLFGKFLSQKELDSSHDIKFNKRVKISFLQKHERFGHYKKWLNKTEKDFINSPKGLINYNEDIVYILASKKNIDIDEKGAILEYILTNGNIDVIENIFRCNEDCDLKELYDINIFLQSTNDDLIQKLKKVPNEEIISESIEDNNNKKHLNNVKNKTIYNINITNAEDLNEKDKVSDDEFETRKIQMICANPLIKYTFEKNTIQEYKIII